MTLEENIQECIEEKPGFFRKAANFVRDTILPYTLVAGIAVTSALCLEGCSDKRTTPGASVKRYIAALQKEDFDCILKSQGFTDKEVKLIRDNTTKQDLEFLTRMAETAELLSVDVVKTQYGIMDNEEIAIVQTIWTGPDGMKKPLYIFLANHNGEWTMLKESDKTLSWIKLRVDLYDSPTTTKKTPSKAVEGKKRGIIDALFREKIRKNETAVKEFLRELVKKENRYIFRHRKIGSLEDLAEDDLISKDIDFENMNGYKIEEVGIKGYEYAFKAVPLRKDFTGDLGFYVDKHNSDLNPDNPIIIFRTDDEFKKIREKEERYLRGMYGGREKTEKHLDKLKEDTGGLIDKLNRAEKPYEGPAEPKKKLKTKACINCGKTISSSASKCPWCAVDIFKKSNQDYNQKEKEKSHRLQEQPEVPAQDYKMRRQKIEKEEELMEKFWERSGRLGLLYFGNISDIKRKKDKTIEDLAFVDKLIDGYKQFEKDCPDNLPYDRDAKKRLEELSKLRTDLITVLPVEKVRQYMNSKKQKSQPEQPEVPAQDYKKTPGIEDKFKDIRSDESIKNLERRIHASENPNIYKDIKTFRDLIFDRIDKKLKTGESAEQVIKKDLNYLKDNIRSALSGPKREHISYKQQSEIVNQLIEKYLEITKKYPDTQSVAQREIDYLEKWELWSIRRPHLNYSYDKSIPKIKNKRTKTIDDLKLVDKFIDDYGIFEKDCSDKKSTLVIRACRESAKEKLEELSKLRTDLITVLPVEKVRQYMNSKKQKSQPEQPEVPAQDYKMRRKTMEERDSIRKKFAIGISELDCYQESITRIKNKRIKTIDDLEFIDALCDKYIRFEKDCPDNLPYDKRAKETLEELSKLRTDLITVLPIEKVRQYMNSKEK